MRNLFLTITVFLSIFLTLGIQLVSAEPVSINRGTGQGFIFSQKGNCYVIFPTHVIGRSRADISIGTAAPTTFVNASIFWSSGEHDLSIAYVEPGLERRCTDMWADFPDDISARIGRIENATLKRISSSGLEENIKMRIVDSDLDFISSTVADGNEIFQGTSGGVLIDGNTVIGMAIKSPNNQTAIFLRMDEIKSELSRLLDAQAVKAKPKTINKADSEQPNICSASTIPIASITCNKEPVSAEFACSNLMIGKPVIFPAQALPLNIEIELEGDEAHIVSKISLSSSKGDDVAIPKNIIASFYRSKRWIRFGAGDMTPFGSLKLNNGSAPYTKRIKLQIISSWAMKKPLRLDCLSIR